MQKLFRTVVPILLVLALSLIVSGCGFGGKTTLEEMDPPQVNYVDESQSIGVEDADEVTEEESEMSEVSEMALRELYLIDQNGLVAPQMISLPKTEGPAKQSLEYLVQDGPVTELLPSGFQAVLPPGTEVLGVNMKEDGLIVADFSEQFKDYRPEDEKKILQAVTWTLTQFDGVEKVEIWINGYQQETMPVNGTPISDGVSRADGINIESDRVVDLVNSKGVTLYFLAQNGDNTYYVPVTRRINGNEDEKVAVVKELLKGPSSHSNLLTDIRSGVKLLDEPSYENGIVSLNFNENILNHLEGTAISEEVLNLIVLSLTEQEGVEKVAIHVDGKSEILKASGEVLSEPVTRPTNVNTGSF
ncbi:GerMN domain-containing protein [Anaerobacillus sp. MEB173]|uniref:GerMN domain-containing protein n=1 Tax=Anaerobacillus sp. MEB173 TaxID=3383345 RepID=UPI003F8FD79E